MNKILNNILEAVGGTPVIRLNRLPGPDDAEVLVKFEGLNAGGSVKSRTALSLIESAEAEGLIRPGYSILTECTTGNQGIGIAFVSAVKGYQACIAVPEHYGVERVKLMRAYGARVMVTPVGKDQTETILNCRKAAEALKARYPDRVFWLRQYMNPANPKMHRQRTASEILYQTDGKLDAFVHAIGTGGTVGGVSALLKTAIPGIKIYCAEPYEGALEAAGRHGLHCQQGIGDGIPLRFLDRSLIDGFLTVTDDEAYDIARRLAYQEGILAGVSSGCSVHGALQVARRLGKGKRVLAICADTGERYLEGDLWKYETPWELP
ncbi:MAG TPA: cysteine synthase family protein [Anaerolineae bacterium]|nr:cysteine synthase family protein [Anaerolineae bacterium]